MNKSLNRTILLIVPIFIFIIEYFFIRKIYPLYYDSDPAYQYLLNGLLILNGHSPFHIDHPGTPVQTLIAGALYISWSIGKLAGVVHHTLDVSVGIYAERYLLIISYVLVLLNCLASYILGNRILQSTLKIGLAFFVQASAVAFGVVFARMAYPEPESLLIFGSMLLVASLAPSIFCKLGIQHKPATLAAIVPGLICGFGIAIKLTFIPMLAMLFLLRSPKSIALSLGAAAASWLVCISPMIKELPRFFNWVSGIATHSGHYGSGKAEFIDPKEVLPRLRFLWDLFELWFVVGFCLFCIAAGLVCWASFKNYQRQPSNLKPKTLLSLAFTPLVLCLIGIAQVILVLKHPGARYMIPALIIQAIGIAWMLSKLLEQHRLSKLNALGFWLLGLVGLSLMIDGALGSYRQLSAEREIFDDDVAQVQAAISRYDNPMVIGTYGCRLPKCALSFGLGYAPATNPQVGALLTDFLDFNIWAKKLVIKGRGFYELDLVTQELAKQRPVLLVTNQPTDQLKSFSLKLIYTGPAQSLYHVTGINLH